MLTLDPRLQQGLLESVRPADGGAQLVVDGGTAEALIAQVGEKHQAESARGGKPVLVVAGPIRMPLRRMLRLAVPMVPVISYAELSVASVSVTALGVIEDVRRPVGDLVP